MVEINIIISLVAFCLCSFFDIIIFNEEILLALCFLAFLFYCFNTLSESIFSSFESRASQFENDLLFNFNNIKQKLILDFNVQLKLQNFVSKFTILITGLTHFIKICILALAYKSTWICYQTSIVKLNELTKISKIFINHYQKSSSTQILYSLILKKSNNDLNFLSPSSNNKKKLVELKHLSIR